jgi:hypothetical protein
MVEVGPYVRATPNGNFVNVRPHQRRKGRFMTGVSVTSDGFAIVSLYDTETGGYRELFVGDRNEAEAVARSFRDGVIKPRAGFVH